MERSPFTSAAAILGAAIIVTGSIVMYGFYEVKALSDAISVTGSAEREITSDVAKWTIQITRSVDLSGLAEGNRAMTNDLAAVQTYLKEKGIEDAWVTVEPVAMDTMYDYNQGGRASGYTLRRFVKIESSDTAKVRAAAEGAGVLLDRGALASTVSVEYFYSKLSELKQQILADAMADAKARAQKMVESGGGSIGNLRSASMGVLQVTARNSVEVADYGMYDTSAEEKKVTAVVRAEFGIR
ncbi:MAG TPA: SIMPL domain-containing protein [Candidatus Peribacterales bacterium]|nr:SIMPL domain-containing protein [Candidatus Peribacterales bacterium]